MKPRSFAQHFFTTHDGVSLSYRHWPAQGSRRGAVIMFHRGHEHGGEATTAELLTDLGVEEDPLQTRLDVLREAGQAAIRGDLETGQILVLTHGVRHVDTLAHRDITNVSVRQIICARAWRSA